MKSRLILVIGVAGLLQTACFHANVSTDYASYSKQLVGDKQTIPATATLVLPLQERNREHYLVHLGIKVTLDSGTPLYEISRAAVARLFNDIIEKEMVDPTEKTDLFLEPKVEYLDIDVKGYVFGSYIKFTGSLSLTVYDAGGRILWDEKVPINYRSGRAVQDFQLLIMRNKIATDAYDAFLPSFKKLFSDFYLAREIQQYLCAINKCPPTMQMSLPKTGSLRDSVPISHISINLRTGSALQPEL